MKNPPDATPAITQDAAKLRRRAETRLKKKTVHKKDFPGDKDTRSLLHELQVYQIELELQNEELQKARSAADAVLKSYTELYDFAPVSYCTVGCKGDIRQVNLAAARMLGSERSKLTGVDFGKFIGDRYRSTFIGFLDRVFSSPGDNMTCELALKCSSNIPCIVHIEAGVDATGQTCRLTMVDITDRKQTEEAIIEAAEKIEDLYNHAPCGYHSIGEDGTILQINDTELTWLGYARDEIAGKMKIQDLMTPASMENFQANYPLFKKRGFVHDLEFEMIRKDGTILPVEVNATAINDSSGNYLMSRSTMFDISKRKRIEQEMNLNARKLETLQKRQVAIQTAAAIAHELNQPLLAIASYSKAAQMLLKAGNTDPDKIFDALAASEQQANRAGQSIRQLIEFLAMDEFPTEAFDLNQEILGVLKAARLEHELKFNTHLSFEEGLPPIQANRTHLQKVLLNLLHNSLDSMKQAGVPLPAIIITVRTKKDENVAQVTIQDNGPGFNAEIIQRLFQPFFTTKTSGIGIGLSISRSLVEANGGQLWVDPQEGPGATVHLTLPFAP